MGWGKEVKRERCKGERGQWVTNYRKKERGKAGKRERGNDGRGQGGKKERRNEGKNEEIGARTKEGKRERCKEGKGEGGKEERVKESKTERIKKLFCIAFESILSVLWRDILGL